MPVDIRHLVNKLEQSRLLSHLKSHRTDAKRISKYYAPRHAFNRWRDSTEGQLWKETQFQKTKGLCSGCKKTYRSVSNFDIDHIKPLIKFPELAIDIDNFQLLCPTCNSKKGDSTLSNEETILYYRQNPLNLKQIAARLGVGIQCIQGKLNASEISFVDWSMQKDPIGISWNSVFEDENIHFFPVACSIADGRQ
ncbi:hypothetical protein C1752_00210 [Acaryochloris thomasi RCC1774]|uniref:HNH nuclease domain-containing protein n=1 Tax=Acaryochloris thomasi RCC1774 TaxID=1764569 RepID=A0A2W1JPP5_9CYAN|nr:HNH endonuclease [Acaryochloris thomasi]PZD75328.1 hypothetical protein C1752_00210 [Acaryochloris thomasi RCC1774]